MPVALLCLSLSILDGSMLPSIKIDWISMKKSNPFLSLSKALLKLAANVICPVHETFPLIHVAVGRDGDSLQVSPSLFPHHIPPPTSKFISLAAKATLADLDSNDMDGF